MIPKLVAIYTRHDDFYHDLERALSPLLPVVRNPASLDEMTFVVADEDGAPSPAKLLASVPAAFLFWVGRKDDATHIEFIKNERLNHLLGFDPHRTPWEAALNLKKILSKKAWGAKCYLAEGTMVDGFSISESKRETSKIEDMLKTQDWSEFFDSPVDYLALVANELVSNALYNGPEAKRAFTENYPVDRREHVYLKGSELVQVNLGIDAHAVVLSVMDCFGTLDREKVVTNLSRSFTERTVQQKKGGAGLGLYLAFSHANQFIINRKAGVRTEVICVIEKNKRYRQYKGRLKSFHFFEEA